MWADGFLSATLGLLTLRNAQKSAFENFRFWTISWECPRVILGKVPDIKNQWIKTYLVFFLCVCVPAPNYIIYLNWRDVSPCSVGWLCSPSPPPPKKKGGAFSNYIKSPTHFKRDRHGTSFRYAQCNRGTNLFYQRISLFFFFFISSHYGACSLFWPNRHISPRWSVAFFPYAELVCGLLGCGGAICSDTTWA